MKVLNCAFSVVGGNELTTGHVELGHGQEYSVYIKSGFRERSDAILTIDGKQVGAWRIPGFGSIEIERPVNARRRFAFYRAGSTEFIQAEIPIDSMGVVSVRIIPEKKLVPAVAESGFYGAGAGGCRRGGQPRGGGTGLGSHSGQLFGSAGPIFRDMARAVTISLRLICKSSQSPEPLRDARSNPVPEAV